MPFKTLLLISAICAFAPPLAADEQRHPWLDDRYRFSLGTYVLSLDSSLAIDGSTANANPIDFNRLFSLDDDESQLSGDFHWRFGENWSVDLQYFDHRDSGTVTLDENIAWGDYVLEAGARVTAGTFDDILRVLVGRRFSTGPNHEFGAGIGFHWMQLGAFAEGEFTLNGQSTGIEREAVDSEAPLPDIGAWYLYAFSPRWISYARADWMSASIDEYSGNITNAAVGISWQMSRHFALGLDYNYFKLDVDIDSSGWNGSAKLERSGPFLHLTANW